MCFNSRAAFRVTLLLVYLYTSVICLPQLTATCGVGGGWWCGVVGDLKVMAEVKFVNQTNF